MCCQKIISFNFYEMGLTSLPPIWTMSVNILLFFLDGTPYQFRGRGVGGRWYGQGHSYLDYAWGGGGQNWAKVDYVIYGRSIIITLYK